MSHSRREAPRELVAILWSIAGLLALFFAISISSLFIIKTYFPVDADTVTQAIDRPIDGKCKEGYSAIAVNNYPGPDNITKYVGGNAAYKTAEVLKPLGGKNFRCSQICVPGLSSAAGSETANRAKVAEYLNGGSLNGKPIVIVSNGEAFMQKWVEWNKESNQSKKDFLAQDLQRTVIQSQSKPDCKGPNSEDYGTMTTSKGEAVDLNKPNTTAQEDEQAGKTTEQASGQPSGGTGATGTTDQPLAGVPKTFNVPSGGTGGGTAGGTEGADKNSGSESPSQPTDLASCKAKLNNFINRYTPGDPSKFKRREIAQYNITETESYKKWERIKQGLYNIKNYEPYISDEAKAYEKCMEMSKLADEIEQPIWDKKTELGKCKNTVNSFLASYQGKKVVTQNYKEINKIYGDIDWLYKNIKYNPYYVFSATNQLSACTTIIKELIPAYKKLLPGSTVERADTASETAAQAAAAQQAQQAAARQNYEAEAAGAAFTYWGKIKWITTLFGNSPKYTWAVQYPKNTNIKASLVRYKPTGKVFWSLKYDNFYYACDVNTYAWYPWAAKSQVDTRQLEPVREKYPIPAAFTQKYYSASIPLP